MKLADWAKQQGISYKTAWRLYSSGDFPLPTEQLPTGTSIIHEHGLPEKKLAVVYARVSSYDQKEGLDRQMERLRDFAAAQGYQVAKEIKEIGSGLNARRKKLLKLLREPKYGTIIVEHRDRLMRFGFEFVESSLQATNRRIVVLNNEECQDDLVQDMISVLTSFCARLYGQRSAKTRAQNALKATEQRTLTKT